MTRGRALSEQRFLEQERRVEHRRLGRTGVSVSTSCVGRGPQLDDVEQDRDPRGADQRTSDEPQHGHARRGTRPDRTVVFGVLSAEGWSAAAGFGCGEAVRQVG
jgi:hypothetical protein